MGDWQLSPSHVAPAVCTATRRTEPVAAPWLCRRGGASDPASSLTGWGRGWSLTAWSRSALGSFMHQGLKTWKLGCLCCRLLYSWSGGQGFEANQGIIGSLDVASSTVMHMHMANPLLPNAPTCAGPSSISECDLLWRSKGDWLSGRVEVS